MLTGSRSHLMRAPSGEVMMKPAWLSMGPSGACSPGIHLG